MNTLKYNSKYNMKNKLPLKSKPRKRATPFWRLNWFRGGVIGLTLAAIVGSGWWVTHSGMLAHIVETAKWQGIALSARIGLKVEDVLVVGRDHTASDELLNALGMSRGAPILAFDVEQAKLRVEELPWVRRASVERLLPDTVLLSVEERTPIALWQNKGHFSLIDYEGHVILEEGLGHYSDFMVVVGEDAPQHTASLMETLSSQPELLVLVRAAVRVGGRRWNLRLVGGVDVQLPEDNAPLAWLRLAQYQRSHSVLNRNVMIVDLRLPDRLIVRKVDEQDQDQKLQNSIPLSLGQET